MPWKDRSIVTIHKEFVTRASQEGANESALCRQDGMEPEDRLQGAGVRRHGGRARVCGSSAHAPIVARPPQSCTHPADASSVPRYVLAGRSGR